MGVQERRDGAITVITIDRPQVHNAVDHATAVDLATRSDGSALATTRRSWS